MVSAAPGFVSVSTTVAVSNESLPAGPASLRPASVAGAASTTGPASSMPAPASTSPPPPPQAKVLSAIKIDKEFRALRVMDHRLLKRLKAGP